MNDEYEQLDLIHKIAYDAARKVAGDNNAMFLTMRDHAFAVLAGTPVTDVNRLCNMIAASIAADKMTVPSQ